MKKIINMPKLSTEMKEGVLVAWNKEPGEAVSKGDVLFEIEVDKVVSEVEAEDDGVMGQQFAEEGDSVSAGEAVGEIEVK